MPETIERPQPPIVYADYSPERKAEVLALVDAADGNVFQVARETGINEATIRYWIQNKSRYREFQEVKRQSLADLAESNAYRLGFSIQNQDLSEIPLNHKATAFGIMIDKMQLLRGQPTSIGVSVERQELTVVLAEALGEVIDVTPVDNSVSSLELLR